MHTDWEDTVCSLAQHLSQELGLLSTASIEAVLQQATLCDKCDSFNFSLEADTPPYAFATMVVLLLPPHAVCVCCTARLKNSRLGIGKVMSMACGLNNVQDLQLYKPGSAVAERASYSASAKSWPSAITHVTVSHWHRIDLSALPVSKVHHPNWFVKDLRAQPCMYACLYTVHSFAAHAWTACKARQLSALAISRTIWSHNVPLVHLVTQVNSGTPCQLK